MQSLEDIIKKEFIPALTEKEVTDGVRKLLALPGWLGGLGISDLTSRSRHEYDASVAVTQSLVESIIRERETYDTDLETTQKEVIRGKFECKEKTSWNKKPLMYT